MKIRKIIGIVLAAAVLGTGCNVKEITEETTTCSESPASADMTAADETAGSETATLEQLEFNPHVYSAKIAERIPQDYWDSFYNLCDALRAGETTFKCSSLDAYLWCTDVGVLCCLFPTAGTKVEAESADGFKDGTGRIRYTVPVEEFLKRQSDFETQITDILNSSIESDDSEYERALKLYLYIADNYEYSDDLEYEDNYVYHTFSTGKGMCVNFASVYAYLLLQAGIDAASVSIFEENMCHSWTYAVIDGEGYHIDTTWALKSSYEGTDYIYLDYFLMSDRERIDDGCLVSNLATPLLPEYWVNRTDVSFEASDSHYNLRYLCNFDYLDEDNKTVHYTDSYGKAHEFSYETAAPELYEFNPHVYSPTLAQEIPQDYWDSFYNMCDALRKGESAFDCSSQDAYDFCMLPATTANFFPAACTKISGESDDGSIPYENGTGRIYYKMPVEEFIQRQADFELLIEDILNSNLESDDNEFEKALKLYLYIGNNYYYDDSAVREGECAYYRTFTEKKGMCVDYGSVYGYLLLQVGIDALDIGCFEPDMCHAWTYVVIDGQGYHCDTTWALKSCYQGVDGVYLDYFLMSDEDRNEDGCLVRDLTMQALPQFSLSRSRIVLSATDEQYSFPDWSVFDSLDEENKVLYYRDMYGNLCEMSYA